MRTLLCPLLIASLAACTASRSTLVEAPTHEALPFIEDDYPRALAEAKRRDLPLFVDVWAPW